VRGIAELPNHQVLLGSRDIHKGEDAAAALGAPSNVNPIQLDVNDDESIEHCAKAIEQHFGKLDILINNAGTCAVPKPIPSKLQRARKSCTLTSSNQIYLTIP
jgi:NADP-dependent 3-hydroxy acid dehydrogenase YdfG